MKNAFLKNSLSCGVVYVNATRFIILHAELASVHKECCLAGKKTGCFSFERKWRLDISSPLLFNCRVMVVRANYYRTYKRAGSSLGLIQLLSRGTSLLCFADTQNSGAFLYLCRLWSQCNMALQLSSNGWNKLAIWVLYLLLGPKIQFSNSKVAHTTGMWNFFPSLFLSCPSFLIMSMPYSSWSDTCLLQLKNCEEESNMAEFRHFFSLLYWWHSQTHISYNIP